MKGQITRLGCMLGMVGAVEIMWHVSQDMFCEVRLECWPAKMCWKGEDGCLPQHLNSPFQHMACLSQHLASSSQHLVHLPQHNHRPGHYLLR